MICASGKIVQLGKEKPYTNDPLTLGNACERYLIIQNFVPHVYLAKSRGDTKTLNQQRKMTTKPPTPLFVLLQPVNGIPGVIVIIRVKGDSLLLGEERYIKELLRTDYKIVEVWNYSAFQDLVKWIKSETKSLEHG